MIKKILKSLLILVLHIDGKIELTHQNKDKINCQQGHVLAKILLM